MFRKALVLILCTLTLLSSCTALPPTATPQPGMPNPASVYCVENGGRLDIRKDSAGGEAGVCVFPDGSECDEWAYFRGECKPASAASDSAPATASAAGDSAQPAEQGWQTYRNDSLGYSFDYPAGAVVAVNDEPTKSLSVTGASGWPSFTISHPADREDFRPPEGANLETWLVLHQLLPAAGRPGAEVRQPDTEIAGATAIHTRFERSPQSYAYDRYYFARGGQLYMILIGHTDDKEDWEMYGRFLSGFRFGD